MIDETSDPVSKKAYQSQNPKSKQKRSLSSKIYPNDKKIGVRLSGLDGLVKVLLNLPSCFFNDSYPV